MSVAVHNMNENSGLPGHHGDSPAEEHATSIKDTDAEPDGGRHMKLEDEITTIPDFAAGRQDGQTENPGPIPKTVEVTGVPASAPVATTDTNTATGLPYCILPECEKIFIILLVSFAAIISPISSSIYFPALNNIAKDLNVSISLINITITTYLVGNRLIETKAVSERCTDTGRSSKELLRRS